jgi:hypothetical protein
MALPYGGRHANLALLSLDAFMALPYFKKIRGYKTPIPPFYKKG